MAIEQDLNLDITQSRQAVRDVLVNARIGLEAKPDFKNISGAISPVTNVVITDIWSGFVRQLDTGVAATCAVMFRDQRGESADPKIRGQYQTETVLGVLALLKAFPDADAYWTALDAEIPILLRRKGRLILSKASYNARYLLPLMDLPYVVEPLGPW